MSPEIEISTIKIASFSKFYGKVGVICHILVTFPSHLKKLRSIPRFWLEKLNCGFFHSFHSWKNTTTQLFLLPAMMDRKVYWLWFVEYFLQRIASCRINHNWILFHEQLQYIPLIQCSVWNFCHTHHLCIF